MDGNIFTPQEDCLSLIKSLINSTHQKILGIFEKYDIDICVESMRKSLLFDLHSIWTYRFQKVFVLELHQAKTSGLL